MIKTDFIHQFNETLLVYSFFTLYANYRFFKWIFNAIGTIVTSNLIGRVIEKLTPQSVIQKRIQKQIKIEKQKKLEAKLLKEKNHQEALERHRKYQYTGYWNIGFIEEDRDTLFKGYEDIKWQWGHFRIKDMKKITPDETKHISFMMFQEMAIYRWQFQEHGKWTKKMELFWIKILPKQFVAKKDYSDDLMKKALLDFDSDKPVKGAA